MKLTDKELQAWRTAVERNGTAARHMMRGESIKNFLDTIDVLQQDVQIRNDIIKKLQVDEAHNYSHY
jgi:hypothetical protein